MSAPKGQGNTFGIAIAVAVVVVGLVVYAAMHVRLPKKIDSKPTKTGTSQFVVKRAEADDEMVYDERPLFRPTAINNSDPGLPAGLRREPGSVFKVVPPKLTFAEYEMKVVLPDPIEVPANPAQAIEIGEEPHPFFAFGRVNYPYAPLSPRLAYLEVLQAKTGRIVLAAPLNAPPIDRFAAMDWKPLEMVVAVEAAGLVGEPTVTSGSESEEIDNYFRALIVKQFRLGARLPPGFYTLRIGP